MNVLQSTQISGLFLQKKEGTGSDLIYCGANPE